jgi:lipopolysaccharide transport system permease protein
VVLFALFALGLGITFGSLFVFVRDIQQVVQIVFQLWFWFTPIVYLTSVLPDYAQKILLFNPSFPFITALHDLMFFDRMPEALIWGLMGMWVTIALSVACFVYRRSITIARDYL